MIQWLRDSRWQLYLGAAVFFIVIQILISTEILNRYWEGLLFWGIAITIVSLGLNFIYGFNGQFSMGQYGFYAIGAYTSADITYRYINTDVSALVVVIGGAVLALLCMLGVHMLLRRFYGVEVLTSFFLYLLSAVVGFGLAVVVLAPTLEAPLLSLLDMLPQVLAENIVFFFALMGGAMLAGIVSFLFGIPVLELGSDYFGIATLSFTIIVKVLLDNTDTLLPFSEMQGARGMIGIPKWTTWPWVFAALVLVVVVLKNILHSTSGRAILSVREDERAAELVGIDVASNKILAFVVGSVFAGLAGGLRAHDLGFLHPQSFNFVQAFNPMIIVVFGGLGSITGTIVAGSFWIFLLEGVLRLYLPDGFETWRFVIYPIILLLMMLLRPKGLLGHYEISFLRAPAPEPWKKSVKAPKEEIA